MPGQIYSGYSIGGIGYWYSLGSIINKYPQKQQKRNRYSSLAKDISAALNKPGSRMVNSGEKET